MISFLYKNLRRLLKYGMTISTLGLIVSVLIQIYGRFFLAASPPWTEEASRLFFIYAVAFGAAPALREGYFIALDFFPKNLSPTWNQRLSLFVRFTLLAFCALMAWYSWQFVSLGWAERSPGMHLKMGWVFLSVFVLLTAILLLDLLHFLRQQSAK
ncbi:MAG: TRAP transporter small permease [Bacteroidota bacterium]